MTPEKMEEVYGIRKWSESEEEALFGRLAGFLNHPGAKHARRGLRYGEFGRHKKGGGTDTFEQWIRLPEEIRSITSPDDLGIYRDEMHREYIPMTEDPGSEDYGVYNIRLPRKHFDPNRAFTDPDFPVDGEIVQLTGKGRTYEKIVKGGIWDLKRGGATALIELADTRL